ncbi:metal ABC transporter substrate-binding protein [Nocardioides sp. C4-1]|uniref:metal ABC transporter substrate-binding protein n=1 Tax=Nocardioides sp. C4-1 TaxID=3151851 RepID=UPI003267D328
MRRLALTAAALVVATPGCAAFGDDADGTQVAAAFYPLAFVADRVAGDLAEVDNLTTPGAEPHDLELTIKETAVIAQADLVIHEQGLQPAVDEAVEQNAAGDVLDAAAVVGLQPFADDHDDHGGEDDGHDEPHHEDDGHDHDGGLDPHFWQDPLRMADLADAVADRLADLDPEHADDFAANAASLRADLEDLDAAYTDGLADCERHTIVVSHDAFGYLTRYGLEVAPVSGLSPDAEPSPATLGELQRLIEDDGITTVFSERLASPRLTRSLAADAGVTTAVLDSIEGLTDETADQDYLSLMRANLAALREANACR